MVWNSFSFNKIIYYSPLSITITMIVTSVILLIWVLRFIDNNPKRSINLGKAFWVLLLFITYNILILLFIKYLKNKVTVYWDATQLIKQIEGNFITTFQSIQNYFLTTVFSYFYVIIFLSLILVAYFYYIYNGKIKKSIFLLTAIGMNYLLAVPFYLFLPVYETWYVHSDVNLLLEQVYPTFNSTYRFFSLLSINFPSLHTSISVTIAIITFKDGYNRLSKLVAFCITAIIFSTLYLGIHWVIDILAGILFAFLCTYCTKKVFGLANTTLRYYSPYKNSQKL